MASITVLRSRVELADAIVVAAREQAREAAARPDTPANRSLYEGCKAALRRRQAEAAELRGRLIRASLIAGSGEAR